MEQDCKGKEPNTKKIIPCTICGKEFSPKTVQINICDECKAEALRLNFKSAWDYKRFRLREAKRKALASKQRQCGLCGCLFTPKVDSQKYCSEKCRKRSVMLKTSDTKAEARARAKAVGSIRKCVQCGKEFTARSILSKFCSHDCQCAFMHEKRRQSRAKARANREIETFVCECCGKTTERHHKRQKICMTCRKSPEYQRQRLDKLHKQRAKLRASKRRRVEHICPICGTLFVWDSHNKNKRYCSEKCRDQAYTYARRENRDYRAGEYIIKVTKELPTELDESRESKGEEYFKALFSMPKEEQWAEMARWTEEDHARAYAYLSGGAELESWNKGRGKEDLACETEEEQRNLIREEIQAEMQVTYVHGAMGEDRYDEENRYF